MAVIGEDKDADIDALHRECQQHIAEIELLKVRLENAEDDAARLHKLATDRWQALLELRCRDDANGSLPPAYRKIVDAALAGNDAGPQHGLQIGGGPTG